jgi:O-antigen ligase
MILFSGALFLIPRLFVGYRIKTQILGFKVLFVLASIFIGQMLLVMIVSEAPFAQEFFGRTGRALGFATYFSLIVILLVTSIYSVVNKANIINLGIVLSCLVSSGYSILQRFGFDIFDWVTYTNGIIGTLGNPNFQSSFAAMALLPALVIFSGSIIRYLALILITGTLIFTLYICQSTQGYLASGLSIGVFTLIYFWYKNKAAFYSFLLLFIFAGLISLAGMLNRGPLSYYLYKYSVQSRGEMWRTALTTANANPIFGVGLDSYGDASLLYRDERTVDGINEFTDNAHNIFLQSAATGGYVLAIVYFGIVILSLCGFFLIQKKNKTLKKD